MFKRLLIILVSAITFAAEGNTKDVYLAYDDLHHLICDGRVNVIMGGESDQNVIEFNPREIIADISESGVVHLVTRLPKKKHKRKLFSLKADDIDASTSNEGYDVHQTKSESPKKKKKARKDRWKPWWWRHVNSDQNGKEMQLDESVFDEERIATVVVRSKDHFKSLSNLVMRGESTLIAKDIESDSLSVDTESKGNMVMEGVMNLNRLNVSSDSEVEIYWVDSEDLDVVINKGHVVLAGRSCFMSAKTQNDSNLDASGLIVQKSWVSARDSSRLSVFPLNTLYAYSTDSALVEVKNEPKVFGAINEDPSESEPSAIVINYVEMEQRANAQKG